MTELELPLEPKRDDKVIAIRRYVTYNRHGEPLSDTTTKVPRRLGGDWVAFFKKPLRKLVIDCPPPSVLRVYLYLASKQTFETFVIVSPRQIQKDLMITKKTFYEAIKYLKEGGYLQQHEHDGNIAWLLNPHITTRGRGANEPKNAIWSITNKANGIGQSAKQIQKKGKSVDMETGEVIES